MVEGLSNEEKGILDMDNGMVILVGAELEEGIKRANGNEKTQSKYCTHTQKRWCHMDEKMFILRSK